MTTDLCEGALLLEADPRRLQQLLENLLENSLRYTDAGGQLVITLKPLAEELTLNLEDTAPGVSPQDLPRLFERLFRVDSARTRRSGGAGLGLSICQNIVQAHGGTINATASELGGLHTIVRLPLNG
jgi:two-component system sensor histidine kinase BaeS